MAVVPVLVHGPKTAAAYQANISIVALDPSLRQLHQRAPVRLHLPTNAYRYRCLCTTVMVSVQRLLTWNSLSISK